MADSSRSTLYIGDVAVVRYKEADEVVLLKISQMNNFHRLEERNEKKKRRGHKQVEEKIIYGRL